MTSMTLTPATRLACPPEVLSRVLDGEAVVLDLGSGTYFGMNEVATRAWELIMQGTCFDALCAALVEEFDVTADEIDRDLRSFVATLLDKKLITASPS